MTERGRPMPGAAFRARAALAPVLLSMREEALAVRSLDDARRLEQRLRERWSVAMIAALLQPTARAIRLHVNGQWGPTDLRDARADSAIGAWATKTARSVSRLFGSLRRGATKALRETQASIEATVAGWAKALPTRHGSLESRLAEELEQRTHEVSQQWHAARARGQRARWRWRTQRDERVRKKHRQLEGDEFAHDEEPSEGRPGQPYGCRCWAEWLV